MRLPVVFLLSLVALLGLGPNQAAAKGMEATQRASHSLHPSLSRPRNLIIIHALMPKAFLFPRPFLAPLTGIFSWRGPASSLSFVAKTAHVAKHFLGSIFLGECKHEHALLNRTYWKCTKVLNDAFTDLTHVHANLTLVAMERDNALVKVVILTKANQAKDEEIKTKDAELAALRAQLSSTQADLTHSQALVAHHERTINELQAEGRTMHTLVVKYLSVSQEHARRLVQTLNFFLAYHKQKSLEVAILYHDLRSTREYNNATSTVRFVCRSHACLFYIVCMSPNLTPLISS